MNRVTLRTVLAVAVLALPCTAARCQTAQEKLVYDALQAVLDAQLASDFRRLAPLLHGDALRLFRNRLSARFDEMLRSFPVGRIAAISGLPDHPKNLSCSDAEVFIAACNAEKARHPEFAGTRKLLPVKVCGVIFENDKTAYVLFSYAGAVHTERTDFDYEQPILYTFRREGDRWLLYSSVLGYRITADWWHDLLQPGNNGQKPEG
jgi:hypothetical protein